MSEVRWAGWPGMAGGLPATSTHWRSRTDGGGGDDNADDDATDDARCKDPRRARSRWPAIPAAKTSEQGVSETKAEHQTPK